MGFFITVKGFVDLTDDVVGTTVNWPFDIDLIYLNNAPSASFTYDLKTQTLTVPSYTSQNLKARFVLYLITGESSVTAPSDPTNGTSPLRYWEARIKDSPRITRSIDNLENGHARTQASAVVVQLSDDWNVLAKKDVTFTNRGAKLYNTTTGALVLDTLVVSSQTTVQNINLNIQKPTQNLDKEATFGDPAHLVRIDTSVSSGFYTGSAVPDQYDGQTIPMLFGSSIPYTVDNSSPTARGGVVGAPLVPKSGDIGGTMSVAAFPLIPISATQAIVCRLPDYATSPQTITYSYRQDLTFTEIARINDNIYSVPPATVAANFLPGQLCRIKHSSTTSFYPGHIINAASGNVAVDFGTASPPASGGATRIDGWIGAHLISTSGGVINNGSGDFVLTVTNTPGGNRLVKVQVINDANLYDIPMSLILTNITNARSPAEVLEYVLTKNGLTLNSSDVTAVDAAYPTAASLIVGVAGSVPTVKDVVKQINNSLFGTIYPEKTSNTQRLKLYKEGTPTITLTEDEIKNLSVTEDSRDVLSDIQFNPAYATQPELQPAVRTKRTSTIASDVYLVNNYEERTHVFEGTSTRFNDIMSHYGNKQTIVEFDLLDESYDVDITDTVQIDHYIFSGNIFITSVTTSDIGVRVKGQVLVI